MTTIYSVGDNVNTPMGRYQVLGYVRFHSADSPEEQYVTKERPKSIDDPWEYLMTSLDPEEEGRDEDVWSFSRDLGCAGNMSIYELDNPEDVYADWFSR